jgi:hypothetical protein
VTRGSPQFPRLLERFDHFDPEFEANFFEVANELRQRCPVVHSEAYGVHLARLELRVALEELLTRIRDVRIVDKEIRYDSGTSRGPMELHIEFTPGPRSASL